MPGITGENLLVLLERRLDTVVLRLGFASSPSQARQLVAAGGNARLIFNNRLDAMVTGVLIALVSLLLFESVRQWIELLSGKKAVQTAETPFVPTRLAGERV